MFAQTQNSQIIFEFIGINNKPIPTLYINKIGKNTTDLLKNFISVSAPSFDCLVHFLKSNSINERGQAEKEGSVVRVALNATNYAILDKANFLLYTEKLRKYMSENNKKIKQSEAKKIIQAIENIKIKLP